MAEPRNHAKRRREAKALAKVSRRAVGPGPVPAWIRMTEEQAAAHHRQLEEYGTSPIKIQPVERYCADLPVRPGLLTRLLTRNTENPDNITEV